MYLYVELVLELKVIICLLKKTTSQWFVLNHVNNRSIMVLYGQNCVYFSSLKGKYE